MPFIADILSHRSVSIVGLEKNTGKTESLNYILRRLKETDISIAITSIGLDGEQTDHVTQTPKPEIVIPKGMIYITSEKHFFQKKMLSDILNISERSTILGRLVTARALTEGKVLLSGPAETVGIKKVIEEMSALGVKTTLVDGALSRLSLASPAITDAMVLATGAAVSANIPELVRKTLYVKQLTDIEKINDNLANRLMTLPKGMWAIDKHDEIHDLEIPSVFLLEKRDKDIFRFGTRFYISGVVSDKLLHFFRLQKKQVELIIHDFSKMFAGQKEFDLFLKSGNTLKTVLKSKLIAVTVNPISSNGITLNSDVLRNEMSKALNIPVYDVKKIES